MNKYKQLFLKSQLQMNSLISDINSGKFNPFETTNRDYESYLNTQDMIVACNRYIWDFAGLVNLTSQQLESKAYQRGSFLILEHDGRLEFTDYAETGKLQIYGKLAKFTPLTFNGLSYEPVNGVIAVDGDNSDNAKAVLVCDYTANYGTRPASRLELNQRLIKDESVVYMQLLNNIKLSIKKAIATCENQDQARLIIEQARQLLDINSPIIGLSAKKSNDTGLDIPVEMFNFNNNFDTQNYCQQIEFYNKKRRQDMGISTPDTFEKKERKITAETNNSDLYSRLILLDGYYNRVNALNLAKRYLNVEGIEMVDVQINPILMQDNNSGDSEANE